MARAEIHRDDQAAHWQDQARMRVRENPGLETMAQRSFDFDWPIDEVWQAIAHPMHWQDDAFHNAITGIGDAGGVGMHFEMLHSNYPIIPWPMPDQRFRGIIVEWVPPHRQVIAEVNVDDSAGSKRTPDHQQTIELAALEPDRTRLTYSVATVRMEGISEVTRFFFRPWARLQLRRAIGKKIAHIRAGLDAA
jgi:hypothetical protein